VRGGRWQGSECTLKRGERPKERRVHDLHGMKDCRFVTNARTSTSTHTQRVNWTRTCLQAPTVWTSRVGRTTFVTRIRLESRRPATVVLWILINERWLVPECNCTRVSPPFAYCSVNRPVACRRLWRVVACGVSSPAACRRLWRVVAGGEGTKENPQRQRPRWFCQRPPRFERRSNHCTH